jgi:hypothetical protein
VGRRAVINNYHLLSVTVFRIPQRAKTVLPRSYEAHVRHNLAQRQSRAPARVLLAGLCVRAKA